ncbi:lyase family protein, partial [uncultured Neisseria sp.]
MTVRIEHDLLGDREIPANVYWGIHTLRAIENFKISTQKISDVPQFVRSMVMVKKATAQANGALGAIKPEIAAAIEKACDEVLIKGRCLDQFPSDVYQGGAGTSVNMNTNEVIANLALEVLGYEKGRYDIVNPMDHVNASQSTNDAYPTGFRLAVYYSIGELLDKLAILKNAFAAKA